MPILAALHSSRTEVAGGMQEQVRKAYGRTSGELTSAMPETSDDLPPVDDENEQADNPMAPYPGMDEMPAGVPQ